MVQRSREVRRYGVHVAALRALQPGESTLVDLPWNDAWQTARRVLGRGNYACCQDFNRVRVKRLR